MTDSAEPVHFADIIAGAGMEREGRRVRHLHERRDGDGYPPGCTGPDIPLPSRVLHAADMLEAMTSSRAYRPGQPLEFALFEIEAHTGSRLDPTVAGMPAELLRSGKLSMSARAAVIAA